MSGGDTKREGDMKNGLDENKELMFADLHCDTLLRDPKGDEHGPLAVDLDGLPQGMRLCQAFAMYISDRFQGDEAVATGEKLYGRFEEMLAARAGAVRQVRDAAGIEAAWGAGEVAALLTVENALLFVGKLERIEEAAGRGVRIASLTWNAANEVGTGVGGPEDRGLTDFGHEAVRLMERLGVVADVSHANVKTFWDLAGMAEKPFIATHSNALAVCKHRRNLSDDQLRRIFEGGGIVGINYCVDFLDDGGDVAGWDGILRHIDHMFELGGERCVALGSDFDGCKTPPFLKTTADLPAFHDAIASSASLGPAAARAICHENALAFFRRAWG